jgi:hypothetical protein
MANAWTVTGGPTEVFNMLILFIFLTVVCAKAPIIVADRVNPWVGVLAAVISFFVWYPFMPPLVPEILNGFLCMFGLGALLITLLDCITSALKYSFRPKQTLPQVTVSSATHSPPASR